MKKSRENLSIAIADLKKNPADLILKLRGQSIEVRDRRRTIAYLVPTKAYEEILETLADVELAILVDARRGSFGKAVPISLDELQASIS